MEEIKLLGSLISPFSWRTEIGLKLKGVKYEYIDENLSKKSDLLLKYNPVHKKVPVLLHNGNPIAESLVILEYIDETWERPAILPKDPYEKAMARFWAKFINEKCSPAMFKAFWSKGEEGEKAKEESKQLLKILEDEINGKKFFGDDKIGLVDIFAGFIAYWSEIMAEIVGFQLLTKDEFPSLCQWIDEFVNDKLVKESLPSKDKLAAFFKSFAEPPTSNEYRPKV